MQIEIPCVVMRGGTSKGLYFLASDLPVDPADRDRVLLAAMGSPDARQIDGMGGAHPLTSKVAVVGPPSRADADVDYLFLQIMLDRAEVSVTQNCGNILAGVGPYAIEQRLVTVGGSVTDVRIHMVNTASIAVARVQTPDGKVTYEGSARIDGVPGTSSPVQLDFQDVAGSTCGELLPTGALRDSIDGIEVTCIDNGMPVVLLRAVDFGKTGYELPVELEADGPLKERIEAIRLALGPRMNLGNVSAKTVPKMCLVSPARSGGALCTRMFIPHRVHDTIGVLGAVSVASACALVGSVAHELAGPGEVSGSRSYDIEHPTGYFTVELEAVFHGGAIRFRRAALLRTARTIMQGMVFVPAAAWSGAR